MAHVRERKAESDDNAGVAGLPARSRFPANDEVVFLFNQRLRFGGAVGDLLEMDSSDKYLASTELRTELK